MIKRSLLAVVGVLVLILSVILAPVAAQDEMMEEEEPLGYGIPEGYDVIDNGDGNIRLTSGDNTIVIQGDAAYQGVLAGQEFEDDLSALTFYLERVGYNVGVDQPLPEGATAAAGVSLSRTGQVGVAYLFDLGRTFNVVISLHEGRGQVGAPIEDFETVVAEFEYLGNIVDLAVAASEGGDNDREGLSILVAAVTAAELGEALSGDDLLTVFAPNNQAFINLFALLQEEYGISQAALLSEANRSLLTNVLLYHVAEGDITAEDVLALEPASRVPTLLADELNEITVGFVNEETPILNGSVRLVATDITASNGTIHIIDNVLLPQCVLDQLNTGVDTCGIEEMMDDEMMEEEEMMEEMGSTIVDIAAGDEQFSTLVAAVTAAELVETLSGEGPFTVFAPTNDAFTAALEELGLTLDDVVGDIDLLTSILTYHVVDGAVLSTDLTDGMEVTTLNGATFTVSLADGVVLTDSMGREINVTTADIEASNGVIHVIDNVLLPPMGE